MGNGCTDGNSGLTLTVLNVDNRTKMRTILFSAQRLPLYGLKLLNHYKYGWKSHLHHWTSAQLYTRTTPRLAHILTFESSTRSMHTRPGGSSCSSIIHRMWRLHGRLPGSQLGICLGQQSLRGPR
eukprot:scaffold310842_cov28-Attheya_sp.AAC.1